MAEATADASAKTRLNRAYVVFGFVTRRGLCSISSMLLLAATTLEKLQAIPARFWWNVAMAVGIFIGLVLLARYAARMNKLLVALIVFLMVTVVGVQWVYERNEPKFMSKSIDKIAPYFPKKPQYREYEQPK